METLKKIIGLSSYDRLHCLIYIVIGKHAQIIYLDLFDKAFRRSAGYYCNLLMDCGTCFGAVYGILLHSDLASQLNLFGMTLGFGTVINWSFNQPEIVTNNYKFSKLYVLLIRNRIVFVLLHFYNKLFIPCHSFQIAIKFYFINDFKGMLRVTDMIDEIYKKQFEISSGTNRKRKQICNKYAKLSGRLFVGVIGLYGFLLLFDVLQPWILYLMFGGIILSIGVEFPMVDRNSTVGLIVLVCFETVALVSLYFKMSVFEPLSISNFVTLSFVSDIIKSHIDDYDNDLRKGSITGAAVKRKLIDILLMQQKYDS